ncbi:MAG: indolepyruvate oxidoreductase subunit beta [Dehalococcoidales bacterium]|nr:indolepyruvate oxidoreductase subunit beta [Dehalococcoidales bacterium]
MSDMKKMDILVTGVGGQGVVLASDVIAETALACGLDVKKTDTMGMAQRGGSVISHVRLGREVFSPLIREGEVDLLLAFEKLEAMRFSHYLNTNAVAIVNDYVQPPLSVGLGKERYPSHDEIVVSLKRRTERIFFVPGHATARELGNIRTLNFFMLGCFSVFSPFDESAWQESIIRRLPEKIREINLKAFELGRKEMEGVCLRKG